MSKKPLVIVIAVVLVGVLAFFFLKSGDKTMAPASEEGEDLAISDSGDDSSGIFDTMEKIKSAMTAGKSLECTFVQKGEDGKDMEMKMQSQGKKFRSSYVVNGETMTTISDGKVVYTWSSKTKKGTKFDIACMEEISKTVPQASDSQPDSQEPEDFVNEQSGMKCSPVSNVDFSIPSDVDFSDTCAEMKGLFDSLKENDVQLPEGVSIPGYSGQ